ncbi:hypothetical protein GQ53DRAFT_755429 [Thozetella sp. PMI_491]|nr:hypothetical protein GQ53DRAFT_755429 [Thozetella sp. PMI_491]
MIVITILFIVFEVLGQYAGAIAFGVDLWTVDEATLTQALKVFFIDESFYLVVLVLSKISVCFFYLRVFPNRWLRMAVYGVMAWVGLSGIIILFMQIFQCMPIDYNWNGWKGGYGAYHCLNVNLLAWVSAGLSIVQDVVILALPLPILFQLNTTWQSKLAIIFMFSLGIFTVITSCIRLRSILMFGSSVNPTWDYSDALIWTGLELSVSMIVISLPAIRALLARTVPGFFGSLKSRATGLSGSAGFSKRSDPQGTLNSRRDDKSVKRQSRFFSVLGSTSNGSHESQLELGDKIHGNVQTEIGAGQKGPRNSTEHLAPTRAEDRRTVSSTSEDAWRTQSLETTSPVSTIGPAIHVKTTMTRTSTSVTADGRGLGKNWVQLKS